LSHETNIVGSQAEPDILESRQAGGRVIRGGFLRGGSYLLGTGLGAVAAVLLLRHLTIADWGRYVTVMALIGIVNGLSEAGLNVTAQQAWTSTSDSARRRALVANVVGLRMTLTGLLVALMVAFTLIASYPGVVELGTLVAGAGAVLVATAATLALPLSAALRLGALTAVDLTQQAVTFAGIGLLVAAGATLQPFFAVQIAAGLCAIAVALGFTRGSVSLRPRFVWREWRPLLLAAAPIAFAVVVNQIYLRILVVLMSLLASPRQTGLFGTAYRVNEVFVGLPVFIVGVAFPVLAHAADRDEERLAYALQRLFEVALVVALLVVVGAVIAADPVVRILGGAKYSAAGPVLRVQCVALIGASLTQVWTLGLVAARRQRVLIATNSLALLLAVVLGLSLIPLLHAQGASIAAVGGELVLAAANLVMLVRARPATRPKFGVPLRALAAAGVGLACGLLPLPKLLDGVLGAAVFAVLALLTGALPREVLEALLRRGPPEPASPA
jgi:O-antigen/teichoic acid export membrane protein